MLITSLLATSLLLAPLQPEDTAASWQLLPSLDELVAAHGEPQLAPTRNLDDLRADLDAIQHVWHTTLDRKHALLAEFGDAKLADADDVFIGFDPPPAASGAIGRRVLFVDETLHTVDLYAHDVPELGELERDLAALHAHAEALLREVFAPDDPGTGPGPAPAPDPAPVDICRCPAASNYTHFFDPPEGCLESWGVTYSIEEGACDDGFCGPAKACEGTAQITVDVDDPEDCGGISIGWAYPPGSVKLESAGGPAGEYVVTYNADVTLNCGEHFVISYHAGSSYPFGQTVLSCNDCLSAFGPH